MVNRSRLRQILSLALPIIGGMASQNVLNLVDTAMVGVLGATALAAVGLASFANFMASAFVTGLSAGVQAIAARRLGEGRGQVAAIALNAGLLIAVAFAIPWSALLLTFADKLFPHLTPDASVVALGVPYWRARLVAMVAIGMNFSFRGYWSGVNQTRLYMGTLVFMHAANILLNYVLIFGHLGLPALGTTGAGIGTAVSTFLGTACYFVLGLRHARGNGFLLRLPDRTTVQTVLRLLVPAGLQQTFFAAGMTTFFWILGQVSTAALAASNVLVHLLLVAILPGVGFGLAAASLAGQALGRGDVAAAHLWGRDVSRLASILVGVGALAGAVWPDLFLRLFLHDPLTLSLARLPLQIVCLSMSVDTVGTVLLNALLGVGHTRAVMLVSVTLQWGVMLPLAYLVGPVLGFGMLGVWLVQVGYRALQALACWLLWRSGRWSRLEL